MPDLKLKIDILGRDLSDGAIKSAISGLEKLGAKVDTTNGKIRGGKKGGRAANFFGAATTFNQTAQSIDRVGHSARALVQSPLEIATRFQKKMVDVAAVAGSTPQELEQLTQAARKLGAEKMFSATQAAEGQEFLAMAGFKTNQILTAMPDVLNLAAAGNLELGRASDISSDIMTAFGLKAEDMRMVVDQLTQTFTKSNTNLEMLGDAMAYVAPVAADANVSLAMAASMAGVLADNGIKASMAGTTMRAMLLRLKSPSKGLAKALKNVGDETKNALETGDFSKMPAILKEIDAAIQKMKPEKAARFQKALFGERAAAGAQVLLKASREGALQTKHGQIADESDGRSAQIAADKAGTTAGKLKAAQSRFEDLQIEIGNKLLPVLVELLESVQPLISDFAELAKNNPPLIAQLGKLLIGTAALAPVLATVASTASIAATALGIAGGAKSLVTSLLAVRKKGLETGSAVGKLAGVGSAGLAGLTIGLAAATAVVAGFNAKIDELVENNKQFAPNMEKVGSIAGEATDEQIRERIAQLEKARDERKGRFQELARGRGFGTFMLEAVGAKSLTNFGSFQTTKDTVDSLNDQIATFKSELEKREAAKVEGKIVLDVRGEAKVNRLESSGGVDLEVDTGRQMTGM